MGAKSNIEWTDATWNPMTGCTKVSAGCKNCYAERIAEQMVRRFGEGKGPFPLGFKLQLRPERLQEPAKWKKPKRIFVGSMTDLFQAGVPDDLLNQIFDVMEEHKRHTYLLLTKRTGRMSAYLNDRWVNSPPSHIWIGTSVENQSRVERANILARTPAAVRFLSCEPLIGRIQDINLEGIDWVIVGGESGPKDRIRGVLETWVDEIYEQVRDAGAKFFFKQWGGHRKCECHEAWGCRVYKNQLWDEAPDVSEPVQMTF